MNVSMQPITVDNADIVDPILIQAYNSDHSFQTELEFYLRLQPDGWFYAQADGTPAGTGGLVNYGPFAYIGLIAVAPSMQRRGVGMLIMEHLLSWLEERGCRSGRLVATNSGARLYSKLGFIQDDITAAYRLEQLDRLEQIAPHSREIAGAKGMQVATLRPEDLEELAAFDEQIFGANRRFVLASYLTNLPGRTLATRDQNGHITGYIVAQQGALGPWIGRTPADAEALLVHALSLPFTQPPAIRTHTSNLPAVEMLTAYGFSERRIFQHMYHGSREPLPQKNQLYALASSAIG